MNEIEKYEERLTEIHGKPVSMSKNGKINYMKALLDNKKEKVETLKQKLSTALFEFQLIQHQFGLLIGQKPLEGFEDAKNIQTGY